MVRKRVLEWMASFLSAHLSGAIREYLEAGGDPEKMPQDLKNFAASRRKKPQRKKKAVRAKKCCFHCQASFDGMLTKFSSSHLKFRCSGFQMYVLFNFTLSRLREGWCPWWFSFDHIANSPILFQASHLLAKYRSVDLLEADWRVRDQMILIRVLEMVSNLRKSACNGVFLFWWIKLTITN